MDTVIHPRHSAERSPAGTASNPTRRRTRTVPRRVFAVGVPLLALVAGLTLALTPAQTVQGAPAPDFALPLATGAAGLPHGVVVHRGMLSLRDLRGHPVLINFFNTQCAPCRTEAPGLRREALRYRAQGVVVLGVATDGDTADTVRQYAAYHHLEYPIVVDNREQTTTWAYQVAGWPTSIFVDAQGHMRAETSLPIDAEVMRDGLTQAGALDCRSCGTLDLPAPQARVVAFNRAAPGFTLRDQTGRPISLQALRGKVVALTFISALCLEQCPVVGRTLAEVHRSLGPDGHRFVIVAVSVDPEVDLPAATAAFAAKSGWHGLEWHYLTGPRPALSRVWNVYYEAVPAPSPIFRPGVQIVHDAGLYLIDPHGAWRDHYQAPFASNDVTVAVRALLSPSAPAARAG